MRVRNRETLGFLLSATFVGLAAVRDVYLGGLFQHVPPLAVAVTAFALCSLVFLPLALARDRAGLAALRGNGGRLVWINVTSAVPWLAFFHALRIAEPALVQMIFFGIGPLSMAWIDRLVPGRAAAVPTAAERRLRVGLAAALLVAAGVMVGGLSGLGPQPAGRVAAALALTAGGGLVISLNTVLCRAVNDGGVGPTALLALRFPGAVILGLALAAAHGGLPAVAAPSVVAAVAPAALLLVVLPIYVNQIGISLASPLTVRAVLAAGPVLVFLLQLVERRLPSSPYTLAACVLYAVFAVTAALARRWAIRAAPATGAGLAATAAGP
jgi:hypothetical protein